MIRLMTTWVVLACTAIAVAAPAMAQGARAYKDPSTSNRPVAGRITSGAEIPAPRVDLSSMLPSLNQIRNRAGVGALTWSPALVEKAGKIAAASMAECTYSSAKKAVGSTPSVFYWTVGIPRFDGRTMVQELLPSYVVSEWRRGEEDYNPATGVCRRSGACNTFSRIATPLSKSVGCAKLVCPSQSQVWVCTFDDN